VIEKLDAEIGIDRRLIGIRRWSIHLVQAEAREEIRLVGNFVIDANRKLIRVGHNLRRSSIRSVAVRAG